MRLDNVYGEETQLDRGLMFTSCHVVPVYTSSSGTFIPFGDENPRPVHAQRFDSGKNRDVVTWEFARVLHSNHGKIHIP